MLPVQKSMEESLRNQVNSFLFSRQIKEIFYGIPNFGCVASVIDLEAR
jgi:hypothetical protein